jgi:hypothetical protein
MDFKHLTEIDFRNLDEMDFRYFKDFMEMESAEGGFVLDLEIKKSSKFLGLVCAKWTWKVQK